MSNQQQQSYPRWSILVTSTLATVVTSTVWLLWPSEPDAELELKKRTREFMKQDLENTMIDWKRSNLDRDTFENFLLDNFPENIKEESGQIWIDQRVLGTNWKGTFLRLTASSPTHTLGVLPC